MGHYEEELSGGSTTEIRHYSFGSLHFLAGAGVHTRQRYTHTGQRKPKSFGHYEEEVSGGSTTEIRHYSFGSLRIAVKRGSTSLTTQGSSTRASRAYYAYGAERSASGDLQTDRTFTGQKSDASGLLFLANLIAGRPLRLYGRVRLCGRA